MSSQTYLGLKLRRNKRFESMTLIISSHPAGGAWCKDIRSTITKSILRGLIYFSSRIMLQLIPHEAANTQLSNAIAGT